MTDEIGNLILERMRRIDDRLSNIEGDMQELKVRATAVDEHLAGLMISVAGVHSRMDRFDERLARIERRLDLTDAS